MLIISKQIIAKNFWTSLLNVILIISYIFERIYQWILYLKLMFTKTGYSTYQLIILNFIYDRNTFHLMRNVVFFSRKVNFCPFFVKSEHKIIVLEPFISLLSWHARIIFRSIFITHLKIDLSNLTIASNSIMKFICFRVGWIEAKNVIIAFKIDFIWIWDRNNLFG